MNIAAKVAADKQKHPDDFCPVKGCLWRVYTSRGVSPCQNHPSGAEDTVSWRESRRESVSETDRSTVRPLAWHDHPKDCPKACCNPAF